MKDILLAETCKKCNNNLTLMTSTRTEDDSNWIVKRCLVCGGHGVEEVIRVLPEVNDKYFAIIEENCIEYYSYHDFLPTPVANIVP